MFSVVWPRGSNTGVRSPGIDATGLYGVPVFGSTQLEQMMPPLGVVSVDRTPTIPSFERLCVLVIVTAG